MFRFLFGDKQKDVQEVNPEERNLETPAKDDYVLIGCDERMKNEGYSNMRMKMNTDYDDYYTVESNGIKYTMKIYNKSADDIFGKKLKKEKWRRKLKGFPFPIVFSEWECVNKNGDVNHVIIMNYIEYTMDEWFRNPNIPFLDKMDILKYILLNFIQIHRCGLYFLINEKLCTDVVLVKSLSKFYSHFPYYINIKQLEKINTTQKDYGDNYAYMPIYTFLPQSFLFIVKKYFPDNKKLIDLANLQIEYSEKIYFEERSKSPIYFKDAINAESNINLRFLNFFDSLLRERDVVSSFNTLKIEQVIREKERGKEEDDREKYEEEMNERFSEWLDERAAEKKRRKEERKKEERKRQEELSRLYDRGELHIDY